MFTLIYVLSLRPSFYLCATTVLFPFLTPAYAVNVQSLPQPSHVCVVQQNI